MSFDSVSLRSVNFPDHYIRHRFFLGELTTVSSDLDKLDASFYRRRGLAELNLDSGIYFSFESVNFPGFYLRHQDFRVKLQKFPDSGLNSSEGQLFAKDATFFPVLGFAAADSMSYRSFNFPDRYIRHRDLHIYLEVFGAPTADFAFHEDKAFFPVV